MNCAKNALRILILFFLVQTALYAQYYESSRQSGIGLPYFDLVVHPQFNPETNQNKLLIIAQFLNDDLTFVKSDTSGYNAEIELLLAIYDENENVVISRVINKKINVRDFDSTNLRNNEFYIRTIANINSGEYTLLAKSSDLNSNESIHRKVRLSLQDFKEEELSISGIMFLQSVELDSANRIVDFEPTVGNNFTVRSGYFYIYWDLYSQKAPADLSITYRMESGDGVIDLDTTYIQRIDSKITSHIYKIDKRQFKKNRYLLKILASSDDYTVEKEKIFSFYWTDIPGTLDDIDKALAQMDYILESDTLEYLEESSLKEKQKFFKEYWKKHDPDPSNATNELKDEYFKRVNYANRNYTSFGVDGWRTDRGRILIKFGFPDDIERHPFEMSAKPYIVWRYYALRKIFLFEDRTGFGDYRLNPNYMDMEFN